MFYPRHFLFACLATISFPAVRTVFLVRPFLKGPIRIEKPKHNFWPFVPMSVPERRENQTSFFQNPDHNFWPFIPVKKPDFRNTSFFDVPRHNFWPFIPIVPPKRNDTKPVPVTPPLPVPTLPGPEKGYDYGEIIYKSILFYEAQRSGWLPNNRKVKWRGHSALEDRGEYGEDLTGGWYDAGDYVKFGFPMAGATSMLLLGLIEFRDAYASINLLDDMYDCVKWPLDYFMKAHTSQYEFYPQVADPYVDHSYWGRPEDMTMYRPAYKLSPQAPGSDVIGETAAALAAGSIAFKSIDKEYSSLLLRHATEMFEFADRYRGLYSDSLPIVQEFYSSSGYNDELAWAAAWIYKATGDKRYLQQAEENYVSTECWAVSWDAKDCLAALLLYKLTKKDTYRQDLERTMKAWMPGGSVDYTPAGLAFRTPWGPLRYTANMATLALVAANAGIEPLAYRLWARDQIHYMLGDSGRSFVIGFGNDPPTRPHHAASSCPPHPSECSWSYYTTSSPNPITLYGALVGGPAIDDNFNDARDDYYQNEVTCDYNAGFQSAVAGLIQLELRRKKLERHSEIRHFPTSQFPPGHDQPKSTGKPFKLPSNFQNFTKNFPRKARGSTLSNNTKEFSRNDNRNNSPRKGGKSDPWNVNGQRNARIKLQNLQKMDKDTQKKHWGGLLQNLKRQDTHKSWRHRRHDEFVEPDRQVSSQQRNRQKGQRRQSQNRQVPKPNLYTQPTGNQQRQRRQLRTVSNQRNKHTFQNKNMNMQKVTQNQKSPTSGRNPSLLSPYIQKGIALHGRRTSQAKLQQNRKNSDADPRNNNAGWNASVQYSNDTGSAHQLSPYLQNQRSLQKFLSSKNKTRKTTRKPSFHLSRGGRNRTKSPSSPTPERTLLLRHTDKQDVRQGSIHRSPFVSQISYQRKSTHGAKWNGKQRDQTTQWTLRDRTSIQNRQQMMQFKSNRQQRQSSRSPPSQSAAGNIAQHNPRRSDTRRSRSPFAPFKPK